jgi:hypothetical protein
MADKIKYSNDIHDLNEQQQSIQDMIRKEAASQRVDPDLAHVVGWMENRYRPTGESSAGAIGPMQIMPATAKAYGVSLADLKDPDTNIKLGVRILKDNLDKYDGNVKAALVAYNGSPTRANIFLRNNESIDVLKPETQGYLQQAAALYPNINERHGEMSDNPFEYDLSTEYEDNKDTGIFGETEELPEHIKNWSLPETEESLKDQAIKYAINQSEVPSVGMIDAYLQSKINKDYNKPVVLGQEPVLPAAPAESSGDKWSRKVVGSLGPGAESSTEAAKNYNIQKALNEEGRGAQWQVNREGIIRDPLELEKQRRIQLAQEQIERESPVNRVFRAGKEAIKIPEKVGAFGKAKLLGPLSTGASAANAMRAYEKANELEQAGDYVGAQIARANAYASSAAAIPASPLVPLNVLKGVGTIGELGLTGAEMLKDYLFPYESVTKKKPKELKKADGGSIPLSLRHVYFHRKARGGSV